MKTTTEQKKNVFNVQVPFFPGFYESILESDDSIAEEKEYLIDMYKENHGFEVDYNDVEFDHTQYRKDIAEHFTNAFGELIPLDICKSIKFTEIESPRYYNFSTDKVYADVELVDDWFAIMLAWITQCEQWLKKRIKEDWTSCDGFTSFMENTLEGWIEGLKQKDERYIGVTLGYMVEDQECHNSDELMFSLSELALEKTSMYEYIHLPEEKYNEFEEFKKQEEEKARIKELNDRLQTKLDFNEK